MTISLRVEILKVFKLEFDLSSDKKLTWKKDTQDEKDSPPAGAAAKSSPSK